MSGMERGHTVCLADSERFASLDLVFLGPSMHIPGSRSLSLERVHGRRNFHASGLWKQDLKVFREGYTMICSGADGRDLGGPRPDAFDVGKVVTWREDLEERIVGMLAVCNPGVTPIASLDTA